MFWLFAPVIIFLCLAIAFGFKVKTDELLTTQNQLSEVQAQAEIDAAQAEIDATEAQRLLDEALANAQTLQSELEAKRYEVTMLENRIVGTKTIIENLISQAVIAFDLEYNNSDSTEIDAKVDTLINLLGQKITTLNQEKVDLQVANTKLTTDFSSATSLLTEITNTHNASEEVLGTIIGRVYVSYPEITYTSTTSAGKVNEIEQFLSAKIVSLNDQIADLTVEQTQYITASEQTIIWAKNNNTGITVDETLSISEQYESVITQLKTLLTNSQSELATANANFATAQSDLKIANAALAAAQTQIVELQKQIPQSINAPSLSNFFLNDTSYYASNEAFIWEFSTENLFAGIESFNLSGDIYFQNYSNISPIDGTTLFISSNKVHKFSYSANYENLEVLHYSYIQNGSYKTFKFYMPANLSIRDSSYQQTQVYSTSYRVSTVILSNSAYKNVGFVQDGLSSINTSVENIPQLLPIWQAFWEHQFVSVEVIKIQYFNGYKDLIEEKYISEFAITLPEDTILDTDFLNNYNLKFIGWRDRSNNFYLPGAVVSFSNSEKLFAVYEKGG